MKSVVVLLVVVLGAFFYLQQRDDAVSVEMTATGSIKHTNDFDVQFTQQATLVDTFMIFGGHIDRNLPNSLSDYSLGALEIGDAVQIQQQYPDFHLCKSPGAKIAQQKIRNLALITETQEVAELVEDAIELHSERLEQGNELTCIELRGQHMEPVSVMLREHGEDISKDILPKLSNMQYYLIDGAEIRDCLSVM
jgi:hypothetical protein